MHAEGALEYRWIVFIQADGRQGYAGTVHENVEAAYARRHALDALVAFHIQSQVAVAGQIHVVVVGRITRAGHGYLRPRRPISCTDSPPPPPHAAPPYP